MKIASLITNIRNRHPRLAMGLWILIGVFVGSIIMNILFRPRNIDEIMENELNNHSCQKYKIVGNQLSTNIINSGENWSYRGSIEFYCDPPEVKYFHFHYPEDVGKLVPR